jgi:hypothetical protein
MNIYEDKYEILEEKLEEISNQLGYLVLDILILSLKKLGNENQIFCGIMDSKLSAMRNEQF